MKKACLAGQMYFRHLHKCAISLKGTTVLGFATMSAEAAEAGAGGAEEKSKGHAGQKQGGGGGKNGKIARGGGGGKDAPPKGKAAMLLKIEEDRQTAELAKISGEWEAFEDEADGLKLTIQMERTVQFVGKTKSFPELQLDVMRKKIEVSRRVWADEVQSALTNNREPVMKPAVDLVVSLRTLLLDKHQKIKTVPEKASKKSKGSKEAAKGSKEDPDRIPR